MWKLINQGPSFASTLGSVKAQKGSLEDRRIGDLQKRLREHCKKRALLGPQMPSQPSLGVFVRFRLGLESLI
jgi:hypothetical protein